jgi:hypothetical protein
VLNRGTHNRDRGWSYGTFSLSGGVISYNDDGGVQNSAIFSMSGGEISNNVGGNIMQRGGGVSNSGTFSMSGGVISNNQATYGGGVYNYPDGNFSLSGNAVISDNKAEVGGGVYNAGTFNRRGGEISGNTATQYNDIYPNDESITNDDSITDYTFIVVSIVVIVGIIGGGLLFISKRAQTINAKTKPAKIIDKNSHSQVFYLPIIPKLWFETSTRLAMCWSKVWTNGSPNVKHFT